MNIIKAFRVILYIKICCSDSLPISQEVVAQEYLLTIGSALLVLCPLQWIFNKTALLNPVGKKWSLFITHTTHTTLYVVLWLPLLSCLERLVTVPFQNNYSLCQIRYEDGAHGGLGWGRWRGVGGGRGRICDWRKDD